MRWETSEAHPTMAHFTGRRGKWTVQLVCLGDQRMGTATHGKVILKLTDDLAAKAERCARGTR
jgi:hypothetical protein